MSDHTTSGRLALSGQGRDCAVLAIRGMTCGACANAVHRALARVPGVVRVEVDLAAGRALAQGSARPQDLVAAVAGAGYHADLDTGEGGRASRREAGADAAAERACFLL